MRIAIRVPQVTVPPSGCQGRRVVDRVYVLGDNVKYIDYDKRNGSRISIHYVDGTSEDLYRDTKPENIHRVYDSIVTIIKNTGELIEMEGDEHESV